MIDFVDATFNSKNLGTNRGSPEIIPANEPNGSRLALSWTLLGSRRLNKKNDKLKRKVDFLEFCNLRSEKKKTKEFEKVRKKKPTCFLYFNF